MIDFGRLLSYGALVRRATFATIALALGAQPATASYTPPLFRVRIDADLEVHTPSVFVASDRRVGATLDVGLLALGAQYIVQKEWADGFGIQLGAAAGWAEATVELGTSSVTGHGYLLGGQARGYKMIWSSDEQFDPAEDDARPSALTAFLNLRGAGYSTTGPLSGAAGDFRATNLAVSAGLGVIGELSLAPWLSFCPYAWFSPGLFASSGYGPVANERARLSADSGPSVTQPFRVGADLWIYPFGVRSESHVSLSAILSPLDTSGRGNRELSFVLAYSL